MGCCSNSRDQISLSGLEYNVLVSALPMKSAAATLSLLSLRMQVQNESKMDASREVGGSWMEGMVLIGCNMSADCEVKGQSLLNVN